MLEIGQVILATPGPACLELQGAELIADSGVDSTTLEQSVQALGYAGLEIESQDRILLCTAPGSRRALALAHLAGIAGAKVFAPSEIGQDNFQPVSVLQTIDAARITHSDWYPWQLAALLRLPAEERRRYVGADHQRAWVGGARMPRWLQEALYAWWGPILHEHLGFADWPGGCVATVLDWQQYPGSAGRWRGPPDTSLQVLDHSQQVCHEGCIGQLRPAALTGEESAVSEELAADSMLGYMDADGQVYPLGPSGFARSTDVGWLTPYEGEQLLESHADVAQAVLWHSDGLFADRLDTPSEAAGFWAFVELHNPALASPLLEVELLEFCARALSAAKCPRSILFVDTMPRTARGGVDSNGLLQVFGDNSTS